MDYFSDKVVLITGGARGIGLATALLLGSRGAKVAVSDLLTEALSEAEELLGSSGIERLAVKSDVSRFEDCEDLVKQTLDRFGRLDVLINNAGVSVVANFDELKPEVAKKLYEVNLLGQVYMTLAALPALKSSRGHVIFLSSVGGIRTPPTSTLYGSSKAALRALAEALRLELKPFGVHVGVISPGFTTTDPRKTVMKGDGSPRPIARPPHDTPEGVARGIAKLIEKRKREIVLTPLGKLTCFLQRLSPSLLDRLLLGRELKN